MISSGDWRRLAQRLRLPTRPNTDASIRDCAQPRRRRWARPRAEDRALRISRTARSTSKEKHEADPALSAWSAACAELESPLETPAPCATLSHVVPHASSLKVSSKPQHNAQPFHTLLKNPGNAQSVPQTRPVPFWSDIGPSRPKFGQVWRILAYVGKTWSTRTAETRPGHAREGSARMAAERFRRMRAGCSRCAGRGNAVTARMRARRNVIATPGADSIIPWAWCATTDPATTLHDFLGRNVVRTQGGQICEVAVNSMIEVPGTAKLPRAPTTCPPLRPQLPAVLQGTPKSD